MRLDKSLINVNYVYNVRNGLPLTGSVSCLGIKI